MILKRLGSYAIVLSLFVAAPGAYAQSIDVGTGSKSTTLGTSTRTISGTSTTSGIGTAYSNGSSTLGALDTFNLVRSDIKAEDATVQDPAEVTTSEDFSAYARAIMANDENITRIESDSNHVSVWYKEPAKFLGIIPVMVNTEARVAVDGSVQVNYPWWYSLFVRGDDDGTGLESELDTTAGTIARSEGSGSLSSSSQARLVNALRSGMKMYHDANISVGTSTDVSTY